MLTRLLFKPRNRCDYRAFYTLRGTTGRQAQPLSTLFETPGIDDFSIGTQVICLWLSKSCQSAEAGV